MDSRSMSMRFPVLDRIKMSAALPHPVPPSPSFLYRVKNAGPGRRGVSPFWIILNPTDRPIATLSNSSSTTTFAAISTRPIPGSRMNFREIPSSPPPPEKYSLQFIEEKRSFNDPHYSPILRPNESFPFVSRNCRSPPVIGYTENFARYRVRGSFLEKCLHSWPGKNRAEPFNGLSLQLLLFDLGFVSVLRIFSAIGWIPRKFLSREKKERRHPRKILAQLIGKRTGTSTEIMFRFCSKSVYQHWPGYLAIPPCYNSYGALERTSLSPFYFGCRSDRFRRSGLVANSIDEQILVRCFPRLNVPDVIEHSNRQRVFNIYLIGFDRYNIIFFSMFKRFRRKNFYPRLIIFKRKASSRAIFICVKTMSLIDDDVQ